MKNLSVLRSNIDKIDQKILLLIKKRLEIAKKIGQVKKENKLPIKDIIREKEIIDKKMSAAKKLNIPSDLIKKIYMPLLTESRRIQK